MAGEKLAHEAPSRALHQHVHAVRETTLASAAANCPGGIDLGDLELPRLVAAAQRRAVAGHGRERHSRGAAGALDLRDELAAHDRHVTFDLAPEIDDAP